ncbi:metallophosphoesterase [Neobacillus niacini]|uniref:metallophosphoesterase n=1 Tax=Neobacillus niacini TaxID=86668 RepID=UPI002FFE608B
MRRKRYVFKLTCFAIICSLLVQYLPVFATVTSAAEQDESRPEHLGMKLYTGEAHSHTSISDGILMPKDAFEYVQKNTNFDYFGTAEHDVTFDISSGNDYLTDYKDSYSDEYKILRAAHDEYNRDGFVTVPGIEVTWYDQAGHLNLYNTEWFPRTYGKGATGQFGMGDLKYDLPTFYARLAQDPEAIVQFNHPDSGGKGDFFSFSHFNRDIDQNVTMFEYKVSNNFNSFVNALDKGWHVSPTYGGDEHQGFWGTRNAALTALWAEDLSRKGILDAMASRRTYATFDENFQLSYSANGQMMGSILPEDTTELNLHLALNDPDQEDTINKVTIYKNKAEIVKEYNEINSNEFVVDETIAANNGEYYFLKIIQTDGNEIISAPIWIGPKTSGTDYAPDIIINGALPETVTLGETIEIPAAAASDDSGETPMVTVDVFDSKGKVELAGNRFAVEEYGEYFVRYYATDSKRNSRVELIRILVDSSKLYADKLLTESQPLVNVGATEDEVGITLVTDKVLEKAFVQYKPASESTWANAKGVKTKVSYFESAYGETIDESNYRIMASHEGDLTGLEKGTVYEYRYGLTENGPWGPVYSFETAPEANDTTIYLMGDLQVPDRNPESFKLFTDMLEVLKSKKPDGKLMVQVGDLVNAAGSTELWNDVFTNIYQDLDLLSANMVGNHEVIQDVDASSFSHFFNLPENGEGTYEETNYSFDYGDVHISVLNSIKMTDEQLEWLENDMRSTDKKWKIVMGHFPYYGGSHSDDPGMSTNRAKITKKMQQLGISLYIGGHDHVYKRTTIRDAKKNTSQEAMNLGTTFITMGSSGPKFYDNETYDWDHVVFDENVQTGVVLEANDDSLAIKAYDNSGNMIDEFMLAQPAEHLELTSVDVAGSEFKGVGLVNYPGSREEITIVGAKYNSTGTKLLDAQIKEVELEQLGREQVITFDEPLTFNDQNTIKLFIWDNMDKQTPIFPSVLVSEAMDGAGTAENPYKIDSIEDLDKIEYYSDSHFLLTKDIDGNQALVPAIGSGDTPFNGVFDGGGHTIKNINISSDTGAGLFSINNGTIKNLAVLGANIFSSKNDVGILVDTNNGTVENSYTTGSITGASTVGGLVGYSNGTIRNSYSTAKVKATAKQSGGLVGITGRGSFTENSYATGSVTSGSSNSGGLSGYGYESTVIQNSIALNPSVITTSSANRVVGRILAGDMATLENNFANENMIVSKEGITVEDLNNEKGLSVSPEEVKGQSLFENKLGWDFENVWVWDEAGQRPVLRANLENTSDDSGKQKPALSQDEDGYYLISTPEDLQVIDSFPHENYRLQSDLDFTGKTFTTIAVEVPFTGMFDGNGKMIKNLKSNNGAIFHINGGTIKNVAVVDADVTGETGASQTGILVNLNSGIVENSYSTGKVIGASTVGGLVGYSNKIIRNSYSNADVTANASQAGGLVGITNSGSLTENSYATGMVHAVKSNAGGVTGYGYNDTVVRNTIALNASVTTPTSANRVVGRVLNGHTATLENNFAFADMAVDNEQITTESSSNEKGLGKTLEEVQNMLTYSQDLGWDFEKVWAWDPNKKVPLLRLFAGEEPVDPEVPVEPEVPVDAPELDKNANGFYEITSVDDLQELNAYPDESYILKNDLDFKGVTNAFLITETFTGTLDGNGKTIKNYHSTNGGLLTVNDGTIKNLAIVDAEITTTKSKLGILANVNTGTIENSFTTGKIEGGSTIGGLVGESKGTVKNSYSTAEVKATSKQAGGLVGITNRGSVTENSYATGMVTAGSSNAGGLSGYAYSTTVIQNSAALNASVITTSSANRIVGRVLAGETATLVNNIANEYMIVSKEGVTQASADNERGLSKNAVQLKSQVTFETELGWDFENVWVWDELAGRPLLIANKEAVDQDGGSSKPTLTQDENGSYLITSIEDLQVINSFPYEKYVLQNDLDFSGQGFTTLSVTAPFTGTFDGNGKKLENLTTTLFQLNAGTIKNVAIVGADVTGEKGAPQTGILVNLNNRTVERSYSTGKVSGDNNVGGLIGYSNGIIHNSYSTANVTANVSQAGGLVGITNTGSLTENSFATGNVHAVKSNAGGISGYAYDGTVIQNTIALNNSVNSPSSANRIVGKILAGEVPVLTNNLSIGDMAVDVESVTAEDANNSKGLGVNPEEVNMKLFDETLGWDFEGVWSWDETTKLPVLF